MSRTLRFLYMQGLFLVQQMYIADLINKFGMQHSNHGSTPMEEFAHVHYELDLEPTDMGEFQSFVGNLIFVTHTRLNLSYVVNILSMLWQNHFKHTWMQQRIFCDTYNNIDIFFPKYDNIQLIAFFTPIGRVTWRGKFYQQYLHQT